MTESQKMDRGTDAMKAHLTDATMLEIRQTRRGWFQECLGCEARTEFKYFIGENQIAQSLEDAGCFCRMCCGPCHGFKMRVQELNTDAELLTVDRPFACCASSCKCCCYQSATVSSNNQQLGSIKETFYWCVPMFKVADANGAELYKVHPPTCCCGCCVNCCTEGNPCCGKGCCKVPFRVYDAAQSKTGGDAPYLGKIIKKPKSAAVEVFTDADSFDVFFPEQATPDQKAVLVGTSIFLNAVFFEDNGGGNN